MSLCFNSNGKLDTVPNPEEHRKIFVDLFSDMEDMVLNN